MDHEDERIKGPVIGGPADKSTSGPNGNSDM